MLVLRRCTTQAVQIGVDVTVTVLSVDWTWELVHLQIYASPSVASGVRVTRRIGESFTIGSDVTVVCLSLDIQRRDVRVGVHSPYSITALPAEHVAARRGFRPCGHASGPVNCVASSDLENRRIGTPFS